MKQVEPVLREHAALCDERATFPSVPLAALRESGLMGLLVPAEYGGLGGGLDEFVRTARELAESCLSTAQIWAMHCFQVDAIVRYGTWRLKDELLPRVASGQVYIASVTSERGRGAGLFSAHAPLHTEGSRLTVERAAPVVTGGAHADGYLMTMRAAGDAKETEVSLVYADRGDLTVETVGKWDAMGMRATESVGMVLKGSVPAHHVVGEPGRFAVVARESMIPLSHLGWSACWLGAAKGALEALVRHGATVRGKGPASGDGGASDLFYDRLGRVRVRLELVSAYLTRTREEVERTLAQGHSMADPCPQIQLNTLKLAASEMTFAAVDELVQLAGLRTGYLKDADIPLERHFRDLRSASLNHANDGLRVGVGGLCMLDRGTHLI
ncbi:acyl-CoA dehydrogenase family protein [Streptomyces formicae]